MPINLAQVVFADPNLQGSPPNVASLLDANELNTLSMRVAEGYETDDTNSQERRDRMQEIYDLFMQKTKPKNWPFDNCSNVIYPLITEAVVNFNAMAMPAILKDNEPVCYSVIGNDQGTIPAKDPTGADLVDPQTGEIVFMDANKKHNIGLRTTTYMNYQLMKQQPWWSPDLDRSLMIVAAVGCCFKKVFFNPVSGLTEDRLILPQHLIVNIDASCIEEASRISELYQLYPYQIEERVRAGIFLKIEYGTSQKSFGVNERFEATVTNNDKNLPHIFVETHTRLDLDGDGYEEPYIVTFHKELRQIVRIEANFRKEGVKVDSGGKIIRIIPEEYYTKMPFVPDPTGSIYDLGFGDLLYAQNHVINTTLNQIFDSATLAALGGGFIGRGLRLKGGVTRFKPGEFKQVDSPGGTLKEQIVALPLPEPPRVLFELFGAMLEAGKNLASMTKVFSGDVPANVPATTMLAASEQSMTAFKAVYKRIYQALSREFTLLAKKNAIYLDPEEYKMVTGFDTGLQDFGSIAMLDIIPVSDPEFAYPTQRLMKAQFLETYKDDPYINGYKCRKMIFDLANIDNADTLLVLPPPPQPTPMDVANSEYMASMAELNRATIKFKAIQQRLDIDSRKFDDTYKAAQAVEKIASAEEKEAGAQADLYTAEALKSKNAVGNA